MQRSRPTASRLLARGPFAVAVAVGAAALAAPAPARADTEAWLWVENRVPLARTPQPEAGRVDLRLFGDFRFNRRSEGLGVVIARMGPLFHLSEWLFVGTTGSFVSSRSADGAWNQQARLEIEPNFVFRIGDVTVADRNRGEYRIRDGLRDVPVYRNMLRIAYAPSGARWVPYLFDEVLVDVTKPQLFENRASLGLGRVVGGSTRVDLGYMFRSRRDPVFVHDHAVTLFFFFDVAPPERTPAPLPVAAPCEPAPAPSPTTPPVPTPGTPPVDVEPSPALTEDGG